jgi:hypothetical protein
MKNMYREKELYNELKDLRKTLWCVLTQLGGELAVSDRIVRDCQNDMISPCKIEMWKDERDRVWRLKAIPNYEKPEFTGDEVSDDGLYVKEKDE